MEKVGSCTYAGSLSMATWLYNNGPWARNISLPGVGLLQPLLAYRLGWEHLSLFRFNVCSFVLLKCGCHVALGQPYYYICLLQGEGWIRLEGCMQAHCPAYAAGRDLLATGDWGPPLELIFPCPVRRCCSIQCLSELCFPGDSDTQMHWTEVFGLLLPVIGNRCHLLDTLWNSFLSWNLTLKGSWQFCLHCQTFSESPR